jgi:uroporphyrinogen-III synthase
MILWKVVTTWRCYQRHAGVALVQLAYRKGMEQELRAGFSRLLVASIGPSTSEALQEFEVPTDFSPSEAKTGNLRA